MIGEFFFLASIIGLVFINNMFSISSNNMMFIDRNTGLLNSNEDRWIRLLEMQQGQTRARKKIKATYLVYMLLLYLQLELGMSCGAATTTAGPACRSSSRRPPTAQREVRHGDMQIS